MSNELIDICDNLSQDLIENQPYTIMMKIIKSDIVDIKYLYILEKCLKYLLKRESNKSFTACIGGELNKNIIFELLNYYIKYDVDIGIINSIILCHGLISKKYSEVIKIALLGYHSDHFKEFNEIKDNIFEQHNVEKINLKIFISLYKLRNDKILSLYDHQKKEFIDGTFEELLDVTLYKNQSYRWISDKEMHFI